MESALSIIERHAEEGSKVRNKFFADYGELLAGAALQTARRLVAGNKVLLCGNGGSAADCQHVAGELVNRFLMDRPALPALALTTDSSVLTAIGNDSSFEQIFARQIRALGRKGDVLFAISTSGKSANIVVALKVAKELGLWTIALTGQGGGVLAPLVNLLLPVPSKHTPIIQEVHLACEHLFCELVDHYLFVDVKALGVVASESC